MLWPPPPPCAAPGAASQGNLWAPAVRRWLGIWGHVLDLHPPVQLPAGLDRWEPKPGCVGGLVSVSVPTATPSPTSLRLLRRAGPLQVAPPLHPSVFVGFLFFPFPAAGTFPWEPLIGEGRGGETRARGSDREQARTHPSAAKTLFKAPELPGA